MAALHEFPCSGGYKANNNFLVKRIMALKLGYNPLRSIRSDKIVILASNILEIFVDNSWLLAVNLLNVQ